MTVHLSVSISTPGIRYF